MQWAGRAILLFAVLLLVGCSRDADRAFSQRGSSRGSPLDGATLDCSDSRLAPLGEKLAQLTTSSTPKEIESIFGKSDDVIRFVSSAFESVHRTADGCTIRIRSLPKGGTRWETSARYVPKPQRGESVTSRIQIEGAAITLR